MTAHFIPDSAVLMVIDLQEKLLPHIDEQERVVARSGILIQAMRLLGVPMLWTEQYPRGLGPTAEPIIRAIGDAARPMEKIAFGCLADPAIAAAAQAMRDTGRDQILLCGIEAHVCILQTALHGLDLGWRVFLACDAVGSRRSTDRSVALERLIQAGVVPVTVEMVVMEALGRAGGEKFKAILPLLKE
jgi:nicotinamidase-related amidase